MSRLTNEYKTFQNRNDAGYLLGRKQVHMSASFLLEVAIPNKHRVRFDGHKTGVQRVQAATDSLQPLSSTRNG